MTCIVGLIDGGDVYLGGDSALSTGNEIIAQRQPKVFRVGDFLIGCSGSARIKLLLSYAFNPPKRPFAKDLESYMATDFLNAMRKCFKDGGLARKDSEVESYYGSILIAHRGRLFHLGSNYSLFEAHCGYDAVGSGAEVAKGALYATRLLPPRERLLLALEAAATHVEGVRPPFTIEVLNGRTIPAVEEPAEPAETLAALKDIPTQEPGD
jgi:ATP-dependent protease HslVU (ClpYQ) peptidase subunit